MRTIIIAIALLFLGTAYADRDALVIEALVANGSDTSKVHEIDFFLDFDNLKQATVVAQSMESQGFRVKVYENEDQTVTIEAKRFLIPTLDNIHRVSSTLESLTSKYGGSYDGWGTEIVK